MTVDVQSDKKPSVFMRVMQRIAPKVTPFHIWMIRIFRGRIVNRTPFGPPVVVLTTVGRRSRQPRSVALSHMRSGGDVIVMGTNGGLPKLPAWVLNLRSCPQAEIEVGQDRYPVIAEFLEGEEWQHHWDQLVKNFPIYDDTMQWAGRKIPLVRLRRIAS
jgi:deazaflavin-dependent oxidoreductase (nitroreductase family)